MDDRTREDRQAHPDAELKGGRKPYRRPALKEYGTVAKLTQTGGSFRSDGPGGQKQPRV